MNLQTAMIFVKDMNRMAAFYRDGLGLRQMPEKAREGWIEFAAGGSRLALHAIPPAIANGIEITDPPQPRDDTPIKLVFETADLDAARAHLLSHGAVMQNPRNAHSCDGLDPEGNVFQIVTAK